MLIDIVTKGSTDRSVILRIIDSTDGTPETGVVYNTSGIDLWYRREGAAVTSITEASLSALTDAHSDGGFLHVGHGYYRLDLPDAAFASGANYVDVGGTVTGMVVIGGRVKLVNVNLEDAVRGGMTALPNANAEAAGGLYTRGTGAGQINQTNSGQIDVNAARTGGTTNTGRDIGASVLLSSGTGTGQISLSSGAVLLQATQTGVTIPTVTTLTNAPSDSSGVTTLLSRLSSTRAGYLDNLSAGAVATAAALTSAAGDITSILGKFTGITSLAQWLGLLAGKQTGNSTARTELRATGAGSGTFDETTDSIEAIRDRGDAAWTTATGFSTLDAAGVRSAVGLASANLDTQLATIPTAAENADAVWDEAISGHAGVGSTGEALAGATAPSAAAVADAVWDEARSGHVTSGTFGEGVASVTAGVTVTTNNDKTGYAIGTGGIAASAFAAGAVDAAAIAADAIGASELAADAASEIAAAVLSAATSTPIDANVQQVNDVTLTGDGNVTPWGPA